MSAPFPPLPPAAQLSAEIESAKRCRGLLAELAQFEAEIRRVRNTEPGFPRTHLRDGSPTPEFRARLDEFRREQLAQLADLTNRSQAVEDELIRRSVGLLRLAAYPQIGLPGAPFRAVLELFEPRKWTNGRVRSEWDFPHAMLLRDARDYLADLAERTAVWLGNAPTNETALEPVQPPAALTAPQAVQEPDPPTVVRTPGGELTPGWLELGEAKQAILTVLRGKEKPLRARAIAKDAGYKEGTLRHHFGPLQAWKYIKKGKNGYTITPAGRALTERDAT